MLDTRAKKLAENLPVRYTIYLPQILLDAACTGSATNNHAILGLAPTRFGYVRNEYPMVPLSFPDKLLSMAGKNIYEKQNG